MDVNGKRLRDREGWRAMGSDGKRWGGMESDGEEWRGMERNKKREIAIE